jgi:hypothetical protein
MASWADVDTVAGWLSGAVLLRTWQILLHQQMCGLPRDKRRRELYDNTRSS